MKVYLSARYARREELQGYRDDLAELGIYCTSRWLDGEGLDMSENATKDIDDVLAADVLVAFSDEPAEFSPHPFAARGGRHVEFGIAIGAGLPVLIVGPRENVFHHETDRAEIHRETCWPNALQYLATWDVLHGDGPYDRAANFVTQRSSQRGAAGDRFSYALTGLMSELGELASVDHVSQRVGEGLRDRLAIVDESGDILYHLIAGLDSHGWRLRDALRWLERKLDMRRASGKNKATERAELERLVAAGQLGAGK